MYVTKVPNRSSPPAVLLRESYRDGDKVRTRTLANLSDWPDAKVEALRRVLKGETAIVASDALRIERSLPHGHVAAVLGMARALKLDKLLPKSRLGKLALAMIAARLIEPAAKLATARQLSEETAAHSLGAALTLGAVDEDELYAALDLLGEAQPKIEAAFAKRHLRDGCLVLYDLTSSDLEGRCCELGRFGYSRDGKRDKLQIVFGLICAADGCPIAVEVFEGGTGDPSTLAAQVAKLKERFGLARVALVGDRGMITEARIREDLAPAGLDWLTALRAPAIQALAADDGPLQLSVFDERDMAEIASPDYPGERLIVCRNKALAVERARKREELACRHGGGPRPHQSQRWARACAFTGRGQNRPEGRRRPWQAQNGQALRVDDHRRLLLLRPQRSLDPKGGGPRRFLCAKDQCPRRQARYDHRHLRL
jgi:hypothetical protein